MKQIIYLLFSFPFVLLSQNEQIEKLIQLQATYVYSKNYDSINTVSKKIIELDKNVAKENNTDYYLALSYFNLQKYDEAIKLSEKIIPKMYVSGNSRKARQRNIYYQTLCFERYEYHQRNCNYKEAYKNLSLINRKFNCLFCGNQRNSWQSDLYLKMIHCSKSMGKLKRVKRIEGKN